MTIDTFLELFSSVGFPIACVIALGVFCWKMIEKITTSQEERENKLYEEIGECRIINQKAIETIAQYAEKLDTIQQDVNEMKTDLTVIRTKIVE